MQIVESILEVLSKDTISPNKSFCPKEIFRQEVIGGSKGIYRKQTNNFLESSWIKIITSIFLQKKTFPRVFATNFHCYYYYWCYYYYYGTGVQPRASLYKPTTELHPNYLPFFGNTIFYPTLKLESFQCDHVKHLNCHAYLAWHAYIHQCPQAVLDFHHHSESASSLRSAG